jgi:hypothetical protein
MKFIFTILFLVFSLTIAAQKYSKLTKDSSIKNFMTWLFKSDTAFKAIRNVDNDILKLQTDNFIYTDSTTLNTYLFAQNIFNKKNKWTKYFHEADANYFVQQVKQQRKTKWNLKINGIQVLDTIELVNNRVDKVLYSYSLPLFSKDTKYVIIIEGFYCGMLCGGGNYNLYERQLDNNWKKIETCNHWEE